MDGAAVVPLPTAPPAAEFRPDNYYVGPGASNLLLDDPASARGARRPSAKQGDARRAARLHLRTTRGELLAEAAVDEHPAGQPVHRRARRDGPQNGDVKAIVAGPGFDRSQFNLATMPAPYGRQPGSTFKAIVLAPRSRTASRSKDSIDGPRPAP